MLLLYNLALFNPESFSCCNFLVEFAFMEYHEHVNGNCCGIQIRDSLQSII